MPGSWESLRFEEASRWSQRQEARLDLSGWVGTVRFGPDVAPFADVLAAMQVLQLGSGTTAWLGVVRVEVPPA